ncbi:hypothetical protein [Paenibacillus glacialis]|uniref:Uncharacterized protein n=1 Tax=Paenibacillus glacialis TaxID=494026 RepID=A0A162K7G3_9BACL|nr:hypothetical protein [Paenibacillus glacialis]OAB44136.1 hypothetical protein PGLA_05555 [Paenibacillus glacialis]
MKNQSFVTWTVIILAALGLLNDVVFDNFKLLKFLLIPALVFIVVFLLFRFNQPRRFNKQPKVIPSRKTMDKVAGNKKNTSSPSSKKNKQYPFQVIDGKKGKDDDQMPKYH